MRQEKTRFWVYAAAIAAMYATLCHLQNIIFPNSASMMIQFRVAEALCVLAFFTPAAIYGLGLGCLVFNLTFAGALPLDFLVGSAASVSAAWAMWKLRNRPFLGLWMPALTNAVLVGWELSVYIGGGFWMNAFYVAVGEAAVLLTLGSALYAAMKKRGLDRRLFG